MQIVSPRLLRQAPLVLVLAVSLAGAAQVPEQDCVIEPHTVVDLASAVEGIVESVEVSRGDLVERDQVLVKLDAGVERAAVEYARARADATAQLRAGEVNAGFASRRADRVTTLREQTLISADQADEAETQARLTKAQADQAAENRRLAQLELFQAQATLARHTILSPIRGVVVEDYLSPGESVKDKPILRLAEIDPLRVEVIVPVAFFGAIQPGQSATVHPEAPRSGDYNAEVAIVDRVADAASGTFRVRLTMANADFGVPSGLKCRVQFAAAAPAPAVQSGARNQVSPTSTAGLAAGAPAVNGQAAAAYESRGPRTRVRVHHAPSPQVAQIDRTSAQRAAALAAATPPAAPADPALAPPSCHSLGPIRSMARADQIRSALAGQVGHIAVREDSSGETSGYAILSPPQSSPAAAEGLAARLRGAGIEDLYVYRRGEYANRIALGRYDGPRTAEARRAQLAALGFDTEVLAQRPEAAQLWLDIEVPATPTAVDNLSRTLSPLAAGVGLRSVDCTRLVASRQ